MMTVVDVLGGFVAGAATRLMQAEQAPRMTGTTDDEWWRARERALDAFFDEERFPTITAIRAPRGFDVPGDNASYTAQLASDDFEFGLERLLDGIEAVIESRGAAKPE
jgi:Tetracyclin repressor-like, C-terminal domain